MSTSSEGSLAELPLPYDISSAVSRALRIESTSSENNAPPRRRLVKRARSVSYPSTSSYLTTYDYPAHSTKSAYNLSDSENNYAAAAAAAYYSSNYPYYNHSFGPHHPQQYFYPHHFSAVHPADLHVQMEVEAWSETATISICNSSSDLLDSQVNIEQLDRFCKYIDSSGDEDYIMEKTDDDYMSGPLKNDYERYMARNRMMNSPPRKKQRNVLSTASYYEDDLDSSVDTSLGESVYDQDVQQWKVELENSSMWREFDRVGTEMVITKAGRRMFPTLSVKVSGLDPKGTYSVKLDILPADNKRYKYLQSEWVAVGRSDKKQIYCEYEHPDSPNSGSYWMDKIIAFKMVKLTNNKNIKCADQIILNSMHKYKPCMKITCQRERCSQSFSFPETTFIAVTAYQSTGVTQLKINNNPYARAFRESISSTSGQKTGGHYRQSSSNRSRSLSPDQTRGDASRQTTPVSSPRHKTRGKPKNNCHSTVSVESGFESDSATDKRKDSTSLSTSHSNPFSSSSLMMYWSDDNSLWNPNIITPDPLMDSTSSFSSPYLEESSIDYEVKDVEGRGNGKAILDMLPEPDMSLHANLEAVIPDDDVFF